MQVAKLGAYTWGAWQVLKAVHTVAAYEELELDT
jgi:hypothetical protein